MKRGLRGTPFLLGSLLFTLTHHGMASAQAQLAGADSTVALGVDLTVRQLDAGYWLHTSVHDEILANGVLIELGDGSVILVDTPWTDAQTERLLSWVEARGRRVSEAIATHSHKDCMGGAAALRRAGVSLRALDLTVAEARMRGDAILPEALLRAEDAVYRDARGFEVFYPGPGHTRDNVVVWHPVTRTLFGGCLVKSERSRGMGYVEEADLDAWPTTLRALRERYPEAAVLVPGHGPPGGWACVANTLTLIEKHVTSER